MHKLYLVHKILSRVITKHPSWGAKSKVNGFSAGTASSFSTFEDGEATTCPKEAAAAVVNEFRRKFLLFIS
jgi:hypothetical protein